MHEKIERGGGQSKDMVDMTETDRITRKTRKAHRDTTMPTDNRNNYFRGRSRVTDLFGHKC